MLTNTVLPNTVIAIIWIGISAYAVFGGADFGAGAWDLVAGGPEKGRRARALIEQAIGPVWEANHVWLIFVLVYLWTAFPEAFVSIGTTMWIPLTLAALGIIFRGSGFAFRKWADTVGRQRFYGAAFAGASVLTPFFLGTVAGGVASGRVPLGNAAGDTIRSWLNPTSIFGGVMAVVATSYVAAVLITREADLDGDHLMTRLFPQARANHRSPGRHPRRNRRFRFGQRRSRTFQRAYFGTRDRPSRHLGDRGSGLALAPCPGSLFRCSPDGSPGDGFGAVGLGCRPISLGARAASHDR